MDEKKEIEKWKKKTEFYKKQLDDLKATRFNMQNDIKKLEQEVQRQKNIRNSYYNKVSEFKKEIFSLVLKNFND